MKGIDINMAAYMSELAFLANPVSNHVQSADMCNQAINSLALISARYTHSAVDIVSLMLSAHLYSICQALDLRAMNIRFMTRLKPAIQQLTARTSDGVLSDSQLSALHHSIWSTIVQTLSITTSKDSSNRFICVAESAQHLIVQALQAAKSSLKTSDPLSLMTSWTDSAASISKSLFLTNREQYLASPDATEYLGSTSTRMYDFVRKELTVPMHRGLIDHPTFKNGTGSASKRNTGTQVSIVYRALREERLVVPIMECLEEAVGIDRKSDGVSSKL